VEMASASTMTATFAVSGAIQAKIWNAKRDIALNSSASLGIASPSTACLRASFTLSRRVSTLSQPSFCVNCKSLPSEAIVLDKEEEGEGLFEEPSPLSPSTLQVQSLLEDICDETRIAELKLKVGDFVLHVKRDVGKKKAASAPPAPVATPAVVVSSAAPIVAIAAVPAPASPATSNSLASVLLPATVSKTASLFGLLEAAADQGLSFVTSPKVGVFRRGRNVRGKVGKPLVEVGVTIKEGQVVGFLEQFGTQQPVEAQVSGEVVQVLWEDGESVGYGDPLISIRPFFGAALN
jgi:biotin carboxyl carrier protein